MADGAASPFQRIAHTPGNPELPTLPAPGDPVDGLATPFGNIAGVTFGVPQVNILPIGGAGPGVARGFAQFYLDELGAFPDPVDFKNITANKERTITLHNTNRFTVDVSAVDLSALSGVSLISPGLPVTIESFASQIFTIEADVAGDASFDGLAVFTTTVGTLTVRVLGRRVIVFDAEPQRGITERITFLSDLMTSDDGTEQAMSLRLAPRSQLKLKMRHSDNTERAIMINRMLGAMHLPMAVQLWYQARKITSAALSTDTVIQCDTASMEIDILGDLSFVLPDRTTIEGEVDSFTASAVTLNQQIGVALPLGTFMMPLKIGVLNRRAQLATYRTSFEDVDVSFEIFEYLDIANVDPAFFATHPVDSLPISLAKLFFDGKVRKGRITSDTDRLDGEMGGIAQARSEPLSRPSQQILVQLNTLADQHAWRRFLHSLRGSWGQFYVPTGTNDLPLDSDFTLGTNTFNVPPIGLTSFVGNVAPRRDVKITIAGVDYYRRITSVIDNVTFETVTLNSVIPGSGSVTPAEFFCSWLTLSRLVGDTATFKHKQIGVSELRFSIRGVIDGV